MILTGDSIAAHTSARRKTANGWHTTYIGQNRNTLKEGDTPPDGSCLYPMAFLVEKEGGAVVKPHFHQADQYQIIVQGSGRLGIHDVGTVGVHYTDAYSAYGPIVAAGEGIAWFTLRNAWDPGARYMPQHRQQLREARARHQHREANSAPMPPLSDAELSRLTDASGSAVIEPGKDGLGSWRYALPAGASVTGPDPASGGGQFWIIVAGSAAIGSGSLLPVQSCVFVGPDEAASVAAAGPAGADLLCVQFPFRARD